MKHRFYEKPQKYTETVIIPLPSELSPWFSSEAELETTVVPAAPKVLPVLVFVAIPLLLFEKEGPYPNSAPMAKWSAMKY